MGIAFQISVLFSPSVFSKGLKVKIIGYSDYKQLSQYGKFHLNLKFLTLQIK